MEPWEVRRLQRQGNIIGAVFSLISIIISFLVYFHTIKTP